jgi:hypothetical protein
MVISADTGAKDHLLLEYASARCSIKYASIALLDSLRRHEAIRPSNERNVV